MHKLDAKIKSFGMAKEFLRNEYGMPFKNDKAAPNSTGKDGVVTNRIIHVDQEGNEYRIRIVKDKNAFHYQKEEDDSETEVDDEKTPDYNAENADDKGEDAAAGAQLPQQPQEPKGAKKQKKGKAAEGASSSTTAVETGDAVAAANEEAGRGKRQKKAAQQ